MSIRPDLFFEPIHNALQFFPPSIVYVSCVIVMLSATMVAATAFSRLLRLDR